MNSTTETRREGFSRFIPWIAGGIVLAAAVPIGLARGAPAAVLWIAFGALSSGVLLFWEAVRLLVDPTAPGDEAAIGNEEGVPAELEERKRTALRALKDIEFEHAIHRMSDDDYATLKEQYRAEARDAMRAVDEGLGAWLTRADEMLAAVEKGEVVRVRPAAAPAPGEEAKATTRRCVGCDAVNDSDAVFCKKCGTRMEGKADA